MKSALRECDTLARIGGDEFVAVLVDLEKYEDSEAVLNRLLIAAATPVQTKNFELQVSASIGVTLYPQDNVDADQLLRHADQAMYLAKQSGKNRYHVFDCHQDTDRKLHHEQKTRILFGLLAEEFILFYQPKVDMQNYQVMGVEALIRWQHPERGLLPPAEFMSFIENSELDIQVGEWVITTALKQIAEWRNIGLDLNISINISATHLQMPDFVESLKHKLKQHPDLHPHQLEIEVLETVALADIQVVANIINACAALGVGFALDDFGTGYSSLSYLRKLPANTLKIDQTFVRDMLADRDASAIVQGVIALAHTFSRKTVAEGVETAQHFKALRKMQCDIGQGYGIARPMPAGDVFSWCQNYKQAND